MPSKISKLTIAKLQANSRSEANGISRRTEEDNRSKKSEKPVNIYLLQYLTGIFVQKLLPVDKHYRAVVLDSLSFTRDRDG